VSLVTLSKSGNYRIAENDQDWRGWPVQDASGNELGRVKDFIIDTKGMRAVSLVLDTAAQIPLDDVLVDDGYLVVSREETSLTGDAAAMRPFEPGKIEVMERTELTVISKRRTVIEELVISRDVVDRKERIRTSIRRLNVDVEPVPKPPSS